MAERAFTEVLQDIVGNVQSIVRSEIRLAKAEVRERGVAAKGSAIFLGVGLLAALYATLFALISAMYGLSLVMPMWGAGLVVTGVLFAISVGFISAGMARVKEMQDVPKETARSLRENAEWLKQQTR